MIKVTGLKRETKRLVLRPFQKRDDRAWYASHCAVLPTRSAWEIPRLPMKALSFSEYAKLLDRHRNDALSDTRCVLGIFHKEVGTLLGYLFIENIVRDTPSHAVLDFRILNIYWGKGYAKEAVLEGLKFKAQLKLDELQLAKASKSKMKL